MDEMSGYAEAVGRYQEIEDLIETTYDDLLEKESI
jgi:hypothetical protein